MKYSLLCAAVLLSGCTNAVLGPLYNKPQSEVRSAWGDPTTIVSEKGQQMWSYKQGECTKLVFFNADGYAKDGQEMGNCPKDE